jgi:hypothetical protein
MDNSLIDSLLCCCSAGLVITRNEMIFDDNKIIRIDWNIQPCYDMNELKNVHSCC